MFPKTRQVAPRAGFGPAFLVGLALLAASRRVDADDTADCIAASEAAQSLRDQRALIEARDKLSMCARDVCPTPIRVDCIQQEVEVDAAMPSLVVRAKDAHGDDATEVKAFCDGTVFATQLDGKSRAVDPGTHTLRFEAAGLPPVERRIVVGEGEKNRLVIVEMAPALLPPGSPLTRDAASSRGLLVPGLVAGAIGLVATVPMSLLWLSGTRDVHDMRTSCAPAAGGAGCPADRVDSARTKLILGDVFMGVAAAGIGTGAVLVLLRSPSATKEGATALKLEAWPTLGGCSVGAEGRF
ncbi:MAG: hypothetical protein ABSF69_21180 [Polyangiaceae bacterium]|jgi:hypothetical protein